MLKSFLQVTWRRIMGNKGGAYLNIVCLALGIAASLFIYNFIVIHLSYDSHYSNQVYRLEQKDNSTGLVEAITNMDLASRLKESQPNLQTVSSLIKYSKTNEGHFIYQREDQSSQKVYLKNVFIADEAMIALFDIALIQGDADHVTTPSLLLSSSSAAQLVGSPEDLPSLSGAILNTPGRSLIQETYQVKGIFKDLPNSSHIKLDALVLLPPKLRNNLSPEQNAYTYLTGAGLPSSLTIDQNQFILRPVQNIHLATEVSNNPEPGISTKALVFLGLIGLIITFLAITNYINNSIINSFDRAKEIGVRKLLGNLGKHLIAIFLAEALVINLMAGLLALIFYKVGLNYLPGIGREIPVDLTNDTVSQWFQNVVFVILIGLFSSLVSGVFPALYFNGLKLTAILKGKLTITDRSGAGSGHIIRPLIVFQIAVSILFLSNVLIVHKQKQRMEQSAKRPFGLQVSGIFPGSSGANERFVIQVHKRLSEIVADDWIRSVDLSNTANGKIKSIADLQVKRPDHRDDSTALTMIVADHAYLQPYAFTSGTNFGPVFGFDWRRIILNEEAYKLWSANSVLEDSLHTNKGTFKLLGVVSDGLTQPVAYVSGFNYRTYFDLELYYPGLADQSLEDYLHDVEVIFSSPFPYFSLYKREYTEQRTAETVILKIFVLFSALAIFIATMGMVGLSSFIATKRSREISLRKLLGADPMILVLSLSKDCLQLVVIGAIIAFPFVLIGAQKWLEDYPIQIEISPMLIIIPFIAILVLFFLVVIRRFWNTARSNPLQAIREQT